MKKLHQILALVALVSVLAFSLSAAAAPKTVKIGWLNPLSGSNADGGQHDYDAAMLAIEDINKAGGIKSLGGAKVELVVGDTTSDPKEATSVAERLLSAGNLAGVVGTGFSGLTMPIQPIAEKFRVPIITNSINDKITAQGYQYTFQIAPKGSQFGETQIEFFKYLVKKFNLKGNRAAIVYENSGYGVSTSKSTKELAEKAGLDVVLYEAYPHGFTDAGPLVTKIKESKAQILFPVAYTTDAVLIVNTMKAMKVRPLVIGGGAGFLWPALAQAMGPNVDGIVSVASWNWDTKMAGTEMAAVAKRFEQKYKYFMTEHAGPSYIATRLIADAVDAAKSDDPIKVREQLAKMDFAKGAGTMMQPGKVKFDSTGFNAAVFPVMIQWQDGKPRTVYPESVAAKPVDFKDLADN